MLWHCLIADQLGGAMQDLFRLWRTVRHLKAIQITNRLYRRLVKPRVDNSLAPIVRSDLSLKTEFIKRPKSIIGNGVFNFLNIENSLAFPQDWNDPEYSKIWLYNLHYFEGLLNADTPSALKKQVISQWIIDNVPGRGNGWEPYPNSLRICNWIKWHLLSGELPSEALRSLAVQARRLEKTVEYHLLGNHLLANAKALIFAGIFFEGAEADKWRQKGLKILAKQLPEQFLADGAHFELSTTYHTLLTEDLLDIFHLFSVTENKLDELEDAVKRAITWLQVMTRPDGALPLFNDAAYGVTPTSDDIYDYATRLGFVIPVFDANGMTDLPESGYYRYDTSSYCLIGDAGQIGPSYLPGHAHCDMQSFELCINGRPYLIDTGTSTYGNNPVRHYERSTAAHNTVQIGDHEQSEIWGEFRVGRRAKIIQRVIGGNSTSVTLKSREGTHQREILFDDISIVIKDTIKSSGSNPLCTARFHFHPSVTPIVDGDLVFTPDVQFSFEGMKSMTIKQSEYAPEFNKRHENSCLEVIFFGSLKTNITLEPS